MSEFGSGLVYPIGLFLKHGGERNFYAEKSLKACYASDNSFWASWWYGAADHLMELHVPAMLPESIQTKARQLQEMGEKYRLSMDDLPDYMEKADEALNLAKQILFEVDELIGCTPEKGDYE